MSTDRAFARRFQSAAVTECPLRGQRAPSPRRGHSVTAADFNRRATALFALLAALALSLVPTRAKPVLTMWGPGVERSLDTWGFDAEVAAFERKHNCQVVRLSAGAGHMDSQKVSTAIAGGVPPSVIRQARFNISDFACRDAFQPLDELVRRDRNRPDGIRQEEFYPATWNEAVYQGRVYGIPDGTDDRALYYNRAVFREAGLDPDRPPRTWDELKAYALKLTKRDARGKIVRLGFIPNFGNSWLYLYSWQNGGEFLSPDGRTCTMDNPYTVQALAYMKDIYQALGGVDEVDAFQSSFAGGVMDPFLTGKVAMKIDGNWSLTGILRYNPGLDFAVAPAPVPAARLRGEGRFAGQPKFITWAGGFSWVIPRGVKGSEKELAWEWIKFDESLEGQRIRYAAQARAYAAIGRKEVPDLRANRVVTAALMREFGPKNPRFAKPIGLFEDLMNHCYFRPVTFVGQRLWDEHVRAMDFAVRGMDPKAALSASRRAVQRELDKGFARERYRELPRSAYGWLAALAAALVLGGAGWVAFQARKLGRNGRGEALAAYLFAAPWIIGFVTFTLGPILASILLSFCDYDVLHAPRWLGLANFRALADLSGDGAIVLKSFQNVLFMSGVGIPLTMIAGLAIALLLNAKVRGMHWYRTAYYVPSITPVVASAILWIWLLNPTYGLIDHAWAATLTRWFGATPPNWLTDEQWCKPAFILMGLWGAGSGMILWLAGLQGVPQHLYEAAELDGAGVWGKFRNVMLPMLTPTIFFLAVMGVIGSLQMFEVAYIMRGGEALGAPADATMMPVVLLFQNAFQYFKMGYASALAWVLFVFILAITLVQLRLGTRWVHYGE